MGHLVGNRERELPLLKGEDPLLACKHGVWDLLPKLVGVDRLLQMLWGWRLVLLLRGTVPCALLDPALSSHVWLLLLVRMLLLRVWVSVSVGTLLILLMLHLRDHVGEHALWHPSLLVPNPLPVHGHRLIHLLLHEHCLLLLLLQLCHGLLLRDQIIVVPTAALALRVGVHVLSTCGLIGALLGGGPRVGLGVVLLRRPRGLLAAAST